MYRLITFTLCVLLFACFVINVVKAEETEIEDEDKTYFNEYVVNDKNGKRIVGGTDANWKKYPWLAKNVCRFPGTTEWVVCGCSSTLIHPFYLLTAGHCLRGLQNYGYEVGVMFSDGQVIRIVAEYKPADWRWDTAGIKMQAGVVSDSFHDYGIQKLATPTGFCPGKQILDILLYRDRDLTGNLVGTTAKLLGWGASEQSQPLQPNVPDRFSATLQQVDEVVKDNAECQAVLNFVASVVSGGVVTVSPFTIAGNPNLMCAAPPPEAGLCLGDSGGPLFTTAGRIWKRHHVLGLVTDTLSVSIEHPCGNGIDIYTRLTPADLDWIRCIVFKGPSAKCPVFIFPSTG